MERENLTFEDAAALVVSTGVAGITKHPACYDFCLNDGSVIAFYPGDRDSPDSWLRERLPAAQASS